MVCDFDRSIGSYAFKSNANVNYAGAINAQSLNNTGVQGAIGFAS